MPKICGFAGNDDCCASPTLSGGPFNRGIGTNYPATLPDFTLDKYEVTVGRFNKFVLEYMGAPKPGVGKHPDLPADTGWQASWNSAIGANSATIAGYVACDSTYQTWRGNATDRAASRLPINCVTWYEAFAFCAWDGARLPTDAEFEYAASGGDQDRVFPWGPYLKTENAVYNCTGDGELGCVFGDIQPVGSRPYGAARWGHLDLTGNMEEWVLDDDNPYVLDCSNNCASLTGSYRIQRGGMWEYSSPVAYEAAFRGAAVRETRSRYQGFRCATSSP